MTRVWLTFVSTFVIFTMAPGMTPWVSRIVPEMLPRVSCARRRQGQQHRQNAEPQRFVA